METAKIIAFYLPQFHPIPENDEWWGKGFTEWTNVGKAKPLYKGHYQPRVPADLGYYDLRLPEVREAQVQLARESGVYGFCYWHYWFGNGKRLLERPFNEVLASGKPDFPFCLGWANHTWEAKNWNSYGGKGENELLIEQKYLGVQDYTDHFYEVLPAFKDKRYIRVDDKPLFYIYKSEDLPNDFVETWQKLAIENDLKGIYFTGQMAAGLDEKIAKKELLAKGFSSVSIEPQRRIYPKKAFFERKIHRIKMMVRYKLGLKHLKLLILDYKDSIPLFSDCDFDVKEDVIPCILSGFDHSPRSGAGYTFLYENYSPEMFQKHVETVLDIVDKKNNKFVFLKSWNEWAEGNYMEPDLKYGKAYIKALSNALLKYNKL